MNGMMGWTRTTDQGQLDAPEDGVDVEIRDIELLLQLLLVEVWPDVARHGRCGLIGFGNEDLEISRCELGWLGC